MPKVIFDYRQKTSRDAFFFNDNVLLSDFKRHIKQEVFHVTGEQPYLQIAGSISGNSRTKILDKDLWEFVKRESDVCLDGVIVVAPFDGPVCRKRVQGVLKAAMDSDSVIVSGRKMEPNRNPQWVKQSSTPLQNKTGFAWRRRKRNVQNFDLASLMEQHNFSDGKELARPAGSQWLMDFYVVDAAIAFFPGQVFKDDFCDDLTSEPCFVESKFENLHWLHLLPIFTFSATTIMNI